MERQRSVGIGLEAPRFEASVVGIEGESVFVVVLQEHVANGGAPARVRRRQRDPARVLGASRLGGLEERSNP